MEETSVVQPKFGISQNVPIEDYHFKWPGVSKSSATYALKSALEFWENCVNPTREHDDPSGDMTTGILFHERREDPAKYAARVVRGPQVATRASRDWKLFVADHPDKVVLSPSEYDRIEAMSAAVDRHLGAQSILEEAADNEVTAYVKDPVTGLSLKSRPDRLTKSGVVIDYKTTDSVDPRRFEARAFDHFYQVSVAMTFRVFSLLEKPVRAYYLIAVERNRPHDVVVYNATQAVLVAGMEQLDKALQRIKRGFESKHWPGVSDEVLDLDLPPWAKRQILGVPT